MRFYWQEEEIDENGMMSWSLRIFGTLIAEVCRICSTQYEVRIMGAIIDYCIDLKSAKQLAVDKLIELLNKIEME